MKKKNSIITVICVLMFCGCSKESIDSEVVSESKVSLKEAASGVAVSAYADRSSYVRSGFSFLNPSQLNKNRTATGGSEYASVYGFNVPEENRARGILWSNTSDTDDEKTNLWRPQGITGFTLNGVRYLLISWYARGTEVYNGTRVTLMDISPSSATYLKYRHIILVQNVLPDVTPTEYTQYDTFAPLGVHAGGLAYVNGKIYMASTNLGVRVFDINKIIEVNDGAGSGSKCGKDASGNLFAFGYRYILPQVGYYNIDGGEPYSSLQMNAEGTEIWTCQYYSGSAASSIVPKIYGFPINSSGTILNSGIKVITPLNDLFTNNHAHGMNGIFRKGNKTWLSCTGSPSLSYGSNTRLARFTDGAANTVRYRWPYGCEALYYEPSLDYLWSLTEFEPDAGAANGSSINRCIFAVKFDSYE